MGCNNSKTKSAKKKKGENRQRDGTEPGEMMVSEISRPAAPENAPPPPQQSDAPSSQVAGETAATGGEAQPADDHQSAKPPSEAADPAAEAAEAAKREEEAAVGQGAAAGEEHPSIANRSDKAADASTTEATVTRGPQQDGTSETSELDFQIVSEEAPTFRTENPQTPPDGGENEEPERQPPQQRGVGSAAATNSAVASTPKGQSAPEEALSTSRRPPPPAAATDAEAVTPVAQDRAPEPTPQPRTERSSAAPSHRSSAAGTPFLRPAAGNPQRRPSHTSSTAEEEPNPRPVGGPRKASSGSSPAKMKKRRAFHEHPPWVDIVPPPGEQVGEREPEEEEERYNGYARAPPARRAPAKRRYIEQIDTDGRTPSEQQRWAGRAPVGPPSETSENELIISADAMPNSTPKERVAARRRRNSGGPAAGEVIAKPPPSPQPHTAAHAEAPSALRTPRSQPAQQQTTAPPHTRTPLPVPPQHVQHRRAPAAAPPIPVRTSYTDPSASAEATEPRRALATQMPPPTAYYIDEATGGPRRLSMDPVAMAAIETSTAALIRAHAPAALGSSGDRNMDPSVMSQRSLPPSTMDAAMYRDPGKVPPSHLIDPMYAPAAVGPFASENHRQYGDVAPPADGAAGRSRVASNAPNSASQSFNGGSRRNEAGAAGAAAHVPTRPPPGSSDYGAHRYGDEVDAVSEDAPSSEHRTPYEVPTNAAQQQQQPSGVRDGSGYGGAASASASHPSKPSSAMPSKASWSPADGPSLEVEAPGAEYSEEEVPDYGAGGGDDDAAAADAGSAHADDAATVTTTAMTAVPANEGHVVERQDPKWELLQPPQEENKKLYQQAKFVAQMRNVTPI
ncbi:hypothetical protein ABB37_01930 [Leptomonas pyrrhocoris]|uniref:Uncharacterized protein n=1 Tax=Leptomonas pyrrhocoris TaxID=157538 RepID=A0A0N0DY42_LEPPY|nr:hypothetical protein ABB37_01930 [Leptomonas pyrrhocoris]KPA83671.1 hypothetical protein ABB37_01930 [Leptomonas pyrrhocoris]|eukprot:XP_015662110.1 hypothetical protein ABB37_01930 [Leptomonas pyrrhocoris]